MEGEARSRSQALRHLHGGPTEDEHRRQCQGYGVFGSVSVWESETSSPRREAAPAVALSRPQISLTMNTYAYVLPAMQREAADLMDDLLSSGSSA